MANKKIDSFEFEDASGRFESWDKYIVTCRAGDFVVPIKNVVKVKTTDSIRTVLSVCDTFTPQQLFISFRHCFPTN